MAQRRKRSISLPPDVNRQIEAAAAESGTTVSTWLAAAAARWLFLEAERRAIAEKSLEAAVGSIPDTGHEWDDDPASWVHEQRTKRPGNREFSLSRSGSGQGGSIVDVPESAPLEGFAR